MVEEGAAQALEYAQSQLCEMVALGEVGLGAEALGLRARFFTLLHNLPVVCRSLLAKAREHEAFEYVLFYERVRMGVASPHFFLDSVPSTVQLLVGSSSEQYPTSVLKHWKRADVIADRIRTVRCLETGAGPRRRVVYAAAAGLSANVPFPARYLVERTSAIFQGLRAVKRADLFQNCCNCNCQRLMYMGEPVESWAGAALEGASCGDADEPLDSSSYWRDAMGEPDSPKPDTRRFCSQSCAKEHAVHLVRMMPDFGLHMDADDSASRAGRARVSEAFRMVLKRNETAARSMRTMRTQQTFRSAVSPSELKRHRRRKIRALNIDLGLLYAASLIAESKSLSSGKLLPGQTMYWRDNPSFYAKALKAVDKVYEATRPGDSVISSMLTTPRFIERLAARAFKLF